MSSVLTVNRKLPFIKTTIFTWQHSMILSLLCIITMILSDPTSLFSYGYALILLSASSYFVCKHEAKDVFFTYHFYMICAIAIYAILKYQFPEYMGLNGGDEGRLDDNRFYAQLVDGRVTYFYIVSLDSKMTYVLLLKCLYPFYINTPLNILFVNVIFTAYMPIFVRRLSLLLTQNRKIGYYSFLYSFLCPFTLFFGCIILRESFTVVMVIAGLCYFLEKKYIPLVVCAIALIWVRFGTLAFLLSGILLFYRFQLKRRTRTDIYFILLILLVIVCFYLSFTFLQGFSDGKLGDSVIRSTAGSRYAGSTIGAIMALPFPINIVLSTIFFLFVPLFVFPHLSEGHYILGHVFQGFLTPLFMFLLWNNIFNTSLSAFYGKQKDTIKKILYLALLFALLLGTISMQSRHKTVLFPILCILAAYGKVHYDKKIGRTSALFASLVIGVQLLLGFVSLLR